MIQMVDRPNTAPTGQDRETLTFKALLYLSVAVHAQVSVDYFAWCTLLSRPEPGREPSSKQFSDQ